jgi:hypothetical protein
LLDVLNGGYQLVGRFGRPSNLPHE